MVEIFGKTWEIFISADKVNINLDNILNREYFNKIAYILYDKNVGKPHYHFIVEYKTFVNFEHVAKNFNTKYMNVNFIRKSDLKFAQDYLLEKYKGHNLYNFEDLKFRGFKFKKESN